MFIVTHLLQVCLENQYFSESLCHLSCSITLVAPLGGVEELLVQHLASCRGSEPQTLGKAALCPYKVAIHPLPSSSPAPFLCLSQT